MNIVIISGSPRGNSVTHRVALHLEHRLLEMPGVETSLVDLRNIEFPKLQSVFTQPEQAPAELREVAQAMFAADGFILVTPEYNGSYSAVLKNLLDHFPKQHRKTFGLVTASTGALGGVRAALQLQELTYALFGIGSPYMLVTPFVDKKFDPAGNLLDENFGKSIDIFIREFTWLTEAIHNAHINTGV